MPFLRRNSTIWPMPQIRKSLSSTRWRTGYAVGKELRHAVIRPFAVSTELVADLHGSQFDDLEDHVELGDVEQVLDAWLDVRQAEGTAVVARAGQGSDEGAEAGGIDVRNLAHVEHDVLIAGGEALFHVKGCNECHGVDGEGAPKEAMRAGPALRERFLDLAVVLAKLRAGGSQHSYINPYTPLQLTEADLRQILAWLAGKGLGASRYLVPESRRVILLAFEQDGQPMTGRDGLIHMVVGMDDFVNRFSHWVSEIDVE